MNVWLRLWFVKTWESEHGTFGSGRRDSLSTFLAPVLHFYQLWQKMVHINILKVVLLQSKVNPDRSSLLKFLNKFFVQKNVTVFTIEQ
jgi:hypothetical protein